jgi:ABC-2 type transport system permease protein
MVVFLLGGIAAVWTAGCGSSPITQGRIERALASTFANLVHLQVSWMGLPAIAPLELDVTASCRKVAADGTTPGSAGGGDWTCAVNWNGPDRRVVRDLYDLFVTTDGCYTATVEGEALARPTLNTADGRTVKNLLYVFEGCFDTSAANR